MGSPNVIKPKDMKRLADAGVICGVEGKALNDLLADSRLQARCVDGTANDLFRSRQGTIEVTHRKQGPVASFSLGTVPPTASFYPSEQIGEDDQQRYGNIMRKYGFLG